MVVAPQTLHQTLVPLFLGVTPVMSIETPQAHFTTVPMLLSNHWLFIKYTLQTKVCQDSIRVKILVAENPLLPGKKDVNRLRHGLLTSDSCFLLLRIIHLVQ